MKKLFLLTVVSLTGLIHYSCDLFGTDLYLYDVEIYPVPEEGGSVELQGYAEEFEEDEQLKIFAQPEEGWRFVELQGDLEGSLNPYIFRVERNMEIQAIFERRYTRLNEEELRVERIDPPLTLTMSRSTSHDPEYFIKNTCSQKTSFSESGTSLLYI